MGGRLNAVPMTEIQVPQISVALCTCNGARWVGHQVHGIASQTLPVHELVVRDDASDDDTVTRVRQAWAAAGKPEVQLRVTINPARLGVARNFEAALRECRGEFIALSDQDDGWPNQRLQRLVQRLQQRPGALLVHGDARMIDTEDKPLGTTLFEELQVTAEEVATIDRGQGWQVFLQRNLVTGATAVLRRQLLEHALPMPPYWLHDEWLGMIAALLGGLVLERELLTDYRRHGSNQIGARKPSAAELTRRALSMRGDWPLRQQRRANELLAWAHKQADRLSQEQLAAVEEKVRHHAVRAGLPAERLRRLGPVWREWRAGGYRRYGRGMHGVLRDLLQPSDCGPSP